MSERRKKIMIVENQAILAMELAANLGRMGYDVCGQAFSGEEALAMIGQCRPDLVLMRIRLAGPEAATARKIRSKSNVPIVFLAAQGNGELSMPEEIDNTMQVVDRLIGYERELSAGIEQTLLQ